MTRLTAPFIYAPPPDHALKILHEDADIIIIDKPSGLLSVPGRGPEKAVCAVSIVSQRLGDVFTVHRLDMDTSGIMVFARTKAAQKSLSQAFQQRRVAKTYTAIVEGEMARDTGRIDLPIAKFSLQRPLRHTAPDGQEAITEWQVMHRRKDNTTRVRLTPLTGRSHQLRLHLKDIGHPILGDPFYGDETRAPRLLLHAETLTLPHPATGASTIYVTPCPF